MLDTTCPGAQASDWTHWQKLGLTPDLLPVVSDLKAAISPNSNMKALGKTPSMFNRNGQAVGIPDWTKKTTTDKDISRWSQDPRLGICLKTGSASEVQCVDCDIGDAEVAADVLAYIELMLGKLPMRYRSNNGRFLLVFRMRGEHVKRIIHTAHGAIERLATGQQFIAVGTHTSGVRYEWRGGLPERIPELTQAEFEALWAGLQSTYGIEPERVVRNGLVRGAVRRAPGASVDDVTNFLDAKGWVRSRTHDGRVNITCPFEDQHTTDTSESATQYLPAGVGEHDGGTFERGHFKCLHAHCAGRTDSEFLDAIGYTAGEFEDVTGQDLVMVDGTVAKVPQMPPPAYVGRLRNGRIHATVVNMLTAVRRPDLSSMKIAWDGFRDEIVWGSPDAAALDWQRFGDEDYMVLREHLERNNFMPIGRELIRDVVHKVAKENAMDSATVWAESLVWDGVERVREFFPTYFRAVNNHYTRAVGLYLWSALAGRALVPGIKADMAIILKSEQGTIKTEGIKAMAPHADAFGEIDLGKGDDVLARQTRGKLVVEISELRGLNSRDHGAIKSWVSRTHEEWVPKFKEFATKFPRRFICLGSTNEDEFLADSTGERRWLPVEVGRTDLEALRADCEQLWAEGVHIFKTQGGVQWKDAETLAKREHSRFKVHDSWADIVGDWLDEDEFGQAPGIKQGDKVLKLHHVLQSALNVNAPNITRRDELRVAKVLRNFGYERDDFRAGGKVHKGWVNKGRAEAARQLRQDLDDIA